MKRSIILAFLFGLLTCLCAREVVSQTQDVYPAMPAALMQAEIVDIDGGVFHLNQFRGKVMLVNLWGTWCGPCRAQMPLLVDAQSKYRDRGFEVIGLNIGDGTGDPETIRNIKVFAGRLNLNYYLAVGSDAVTKQIYLLGGQGDIVPQTILIDREGRLRGVFIGAGDRVNEAMVATLQKIMTE